MEKKLSDDELKELFSEWIDRIERKTFYEVTIEDKVHKVPMPIKRISRYISRLYAEIDHAPNIQDIDNWKERKKLQRKIDTIDTKIASAMLLNRWMLVPFIHSLHWRWLELTKTDKYIAGIIRCGYMPDKQGFFLLSSNSIKTHYESLQMMIRMDQK